MSKINLNLKAFKHVSSTDKSTTLQHKDGHVLNISHKSLSPEHKEQLLALAKGEKKGKNIESKTKAADKEPMMMAEGGMAEEVHTLPWSKMTQEQKLQALALDQDTFRRAMEMAAGTMGTVAPEAVEAQEIARGVTKIPANGPGLPARGVGPGVKIVDPTPTYNPNVTAIIDKTPVIRPKVPAFAEGGDVEEETPKDIQEVADTAFTLDPVKAAPALREAYTTGLENAIQERKSDLLENELMKAQTPFSIGAGHDLSPEEAELKATKQVLGRQNMEADARATEQAKKDAAQQQLVQLRQQAGLPSPSAPTAGGSIPADQSQAIAQGKEMAGATGVAPQGSMPDPMAGIAQGYQTQMQGVADEAKAREALANNEQAILNKRQADYERIQADFSNKYNTLEEERKAHLQDIQNGHIDPNQYWTGDAQGNGSHSKIASAIGIILAGFNPTSKPNAAIDFLKSQMEMNLKAQAENLGSKQNLLSANLKQFGNLNDAMQMTRIMQNDIVTNELRMAAAKAASPLAKAAAMQAIGPLQREAGQMQYQMAMRQMMMGASMGANGAGGASSSDAEYNKLHGYLMATDPQKAAMLEKHYVPGVGMSHVEVPDSVREKIVMKNTTQQALKRMYDWSKQHSGSLSPAEINRGKAMAAELQSMYRQAINGGVYKAGEQEFIDQIIDSDPTKFFASIRTLPKLQEVMNQNEHSLNVLKRGYGLPESQPQVDQQEIIKSKDGKNYRKQVVNGKVWLVPVQGKK